MVVGWPHIFILCKKDRLSLIFQQLLLFHQLISLESGLKLSNHLLAVDYLHLRISSLVVNVGHSFHLHLKVFQRDMIFLLLGVLRNFVFLVRNFVTVFGVSQLTLQLFHFFFLLGFAMILFEVILSNCIVVVNLF